MKKIPLPLQLLGVILFVFLFGTYIPELFIRFFYTFSVLFKTLLLIFLPFMLSAFIFNGIMSFKKGATAVLLILLGCIFISDVVTAIFAYGAGALVLPSLIGSITLPELSIKSGLLPLIPIEFIDFKINWGRILVYFILGSIFSGVLSSFFEAPAFKKKMLRFKEIVEVILKYVFIPVLPLYVFGFLLEIQHEGVFSELFTHYGKVVLLIFATHAVWLSFFYWVAARFSVRSALRAMQNALPAYLTAFSTMSSMVSLPLSIEAAEENTNNKPLAEMSMPIMANLHFMGVVTNMPLLAMATMMIFRGGDVPLMADYFPFVIALCQTMVAISGVPGSGIILMTPLLGTYFGFSTEMLSVVTALYLLIESFGTAANVFGDGALIMIVNRIIRRLRLG